MFSFRSVLIIAPIGAVMTTLAALSGISMFAYYTKLGCDPIRGNIIRDANQVTRMNKIIRIFFSFFFPSRSAGAAVP